MSTSADVLSALDPDITVSQLAEHHMRAQLDMYFASQKRQWNRDVSSLSCIATGEVMKGLEQSEDIQSAVEQLADVLDPTILRHVLQNPKASYRLLRAFHDLEVSPGRRAIDLDEAIIRNERYIRTSDHADGRYLVSLEDLAGMLSNHTKDAEYVTFVRKDPPKGGLEVLDDLRKRTMQMLPNSARFARTFHQITDGVLNGLDWNNVFVAGGLALKILLHIDRSTHNNVELQQPDIEVYVYGLGAEAANRKAEQIHDIWAANSPVSVERMVVKNANTITLLSSNPDRRIQIFLKLPSSPTEILLNFDLDPCAIGFDGSLVSMLPRCARAIETGYSVLTMDIIFGHSLSGRQASTETRIFKYARYGFGLRILPSYAKHLELDRHRQKDAESWMSTDLQNTPFAKEQRNRYPLGSAEAGLKILRRISYLAQDYVSRLVFGPTRLSLYAGRAQHTWHRDVLDGVQNDWNVWGDEARWQECDTEARRHREELKAHNDDARLSGGKLYAPKIELYDLGNWHSCLHYFELFSRSCEAWSKHARHEALFHFGRWDIDEVFAEMQDYDNESESYWGMSFDSNELQLAIEDGNTRSFEIIKAIICERLGIPPARNSEYRNYLTRRIRREVCGPDFQTVQEKQITIPLVIPVELEEYLVSRIKEDFPDIPQHANSFRPIIPVHDSTKYDSNTTTLPSLHDIATEKGNLRYWVITNESMWAGQHRALDEMAEILWSLHSTLPQLAASGCSFARLGDHYLNRWHKYLLCGSKDADRREALLFRHWALPTPKPTPITELPDSERMDKAHPMFDEIAVLYPFPDDYFWQDGDEGEWDNGEDGVPEWRTVHVEDGTRNTPAAQFFDPKNLRAAEVPHTPLQEEIERGPFYRGVLRTR